MFTSPSENSSLDRNLCDGLGIAAGDVIYQ